jgi:hypothetical protein
VSSPLRIITLTPVSWVKPSTHSAVKLRCCAFYIVISCAWPCDIVAVNAAQNNNNAGTRIRTLQLIEFTLRPVLILSATKAKSLPHPPKWIGTVRVRTPPPKSGGRSRNGLARRGSETASASSAGLPDEPIMRTDSTWPDQGMVKATEAVPVLAAPDGYRL